MPRAVLARLLALGCILAIACAAPLARAAASAQVTIDVPQGKLKSVRLRHLPGGTQVAIAISSTGRLGVALVSRAQLKTGKPRALFRAALDRKLSFRLVIPTSDDYYLVLDNRRGDSPVRVTATVSASRAKPDPKRGGKFDQTRAGGAPGA